MAELTIDLAIPRFKANENRVDVFVNGGQTTDMVTSTGSSVPSIAKMAKKITDDGNALIAAKDAAINTAADGVLAGSVAASDAAMAARDVTTAARDVTTAARDVTTAARDDAITAKNDAEAALASLSTDLSGLIHAADEEPVLLDDFEVGFWNNLTSALGRIKGSSLLATFKLAVQDWLTPTGQYAFFARSTAPNGWIKANGSTIGNPTSGAAYANAKAYALFILLWQEHDNAILPILSSTGSASTRGANADADWTANKRLPVPDRRGRFMRGLDDSRGVDTGRVLGSFQGEMIGPHGHPFTGSPLDPHQHPNYTSTGRYGANGQSYGTMQGAAGDSDRGTQTLTIAAVSAGTPSGTVGNNTGTENRPGNYADLVCIKL